MTQSTQIYVALLRNHFTVVRAEDMPGGERFHLGIGAVVSAYDNGTVLVQGRIKAKYQDWAYKKLTRILPEHTRWHDT